METAMQNAAEDDASAFFSLVNHPVKFRLYLLVNLPAAFFSGLRVVQASRHGCAVSVPYKRFTKNPFRSTYFACLSMAAELSTGVLAMASVYRQKPSVGLLITAVDGKFYKKATGLTVFTCADGEAIRDAVSAAVATKQGQQATAHAVGKNKSGETVAEFWFTWSFKARTAG